MAIICMFFPAILYCYIRNQISETTADERLIIKNFLFDYVSAVIFVNLLIYIVVVYGFKNNGNLYSQINRLGSFAIKYLALGLLLSCFIPFAEKFLKSRVTFECGFLGIKKITHWKRIIGFYAFILFLMNFVRIFDNNFWGDECIPIVAAQQSFMGMLKFCSRHTPLHYTLIWAAVQVFGSHGAVYHLVSLIPYIIGLILSLTVIYKWFGKETSIIFISFSSLLECAVRYNVEVRMYSWCALFILLFYLTLYKIYENEKTSYFVLATLFAAGAEYSHNFSLAYIAILYLILLLYSFIKRNYVLMLKAFLSGSAALALYIPWMAFQKATSGTVMPNYNLKANSIAECLYYMFQSKYSKLFVIMFFLAFGFVALHETNILVFEKKSADGKYKIGICTDKIVFQPSTVWLISGVSGTFGTIIAARLISDIIFPILLLRYVYATFIIIWLLFGICISKYRFKTLYSTIIVMLILVSCIPSYFAVYKTDSNQNQKLRTTLKIMNPLFDEDDIILTDGTHLAWTVIKAYYPTIKYQEFKLPDIPALEEKDKQYWLMLVEEMPDDIHQQLNKIGYKGETVITDGILGGNRIWLYKVVEFEEPMKRSE